MPILAQCWCYYYLLCNTQGVKKIKTSSYQSKISGPVETCLRDIRVALPAVDALLSRYADTKLRDYVKQLSLLNHQGFQCRQDFISAIADYTSALLGPDTGAAISDDLRELPQVLTANHHGIDTFAQSTQSNLLFSMRKRADGKPVNTIPILACGSIPLNNLTYPRGLLIYAVSNATSGHGGICKLPIFPDSYKRKLVSVSGPFTAEMLSRSLARSKKLVVDNNLSQQFELAVNRVFDDFRKIGHEFADYSSQATVTNHRIWKRLFRGDSCPAELVYIELEKIVSRLLEKDLFDPSTICHQLMFEPELRERLIEKLDGERGCWQYEKLLRRCYGVSTEEGLSAANTPLGTMFFWGVDAKGRSIPLCVYKDGTQAGVELRGADDSGKLLIIPFTPAGIAQGLQEGVLLPSIFTSYLVVSIARGVSCIGGYYQADYLPVMRKAVTETLRGNSGESTRATDVAKTGSDLYLSGMQMTGLEDEGRLLPAGPLEIIASGGLDSEQYEQIGEVTTRQSHIASLYDTIIDVAPQGVNSYPQQNEIAKCVHDMVGSKIVAISVS